MSLSLRDPIYDPCPLCHAQPGASCSPDCDAAYVEEVEPDTWTEHGGHRGGESTCALCSLERALNGYRES
jgi:hypothetical protein